MIVSWASQYEILQVYTGWINPYEAASVLID